jgi:hypothetical protein
MVERWFGELTQKRIRRDSFCSVPQLVDAIMAYVEQHNEHPQACVWSAKVEDILEKVRRPRAMLDKMASG